jgi:isopropylmalate/isohomocitrate dehydrogenase-like protein
MRQFMYEIIIIPGDGVGPEVMNSTLDIMDKLDLDFQYKFGKAGNNCFQELGTTIPQETIDLVRGADATLFGAVTTVPGQKSAIITLRQEMELYANLRPIKSYPGINSLYKGLKFYIIRENTEGMYSGQEKLTRDGAEALRVITRKASRRICRFAFELAKKNGYSKVTAVHKANVLKKTDGIFKESFYQTAMDYEDLKTEDLYVDAAAMFLVTNPQRFQVIVTTNLFGDILSDEAAGLVGGLGIAPSANIGDNNALFEPVHGSAPDIVGKGISNPSAMILSAVMMLEYLGEHDEATKLENALINVLSEGKHVTPDIGGKSSNKQMSHAIKRKLIKM